MPINGKGYMWIELGRGWGLWMGGDELMEVGGRGRGGVVSASKSHPPVVWRTPHNMGGLALAWFAQFDIPFANSHSIKLKRHDIFSHCILLVRD